MQWPRNVGTVEEAKVLNFDVDRFLSIQGGAVGLADSLDACVRECMQRRPVDSVYFVGSGGAGILMHIYSLDRQAFVPSHRSRPKWCCSLMCIWAPTAW